MTGQRQNVDKIAEAYNGINFQVSAAKALRIHCSIVGKQTCQLPATVLRRSELTGIVSLLLPCHKEQCGSGFFGLLQNNIEETFIFRALIQLNQNISTGFFPAFRTELGAGRELVPAMNA